MILCKLLINRMLKILLTFAFLQLQGCYSDAISELIKRSKNVALLQTSSQSSLSNTLNPSSLAIDDSPVTCSHTGAEKGENWMVELDKKHPIAAIIVNTGLTFFGHNIEIHAGENLTSLTLCNYGPKNDTFKDHIITCINGPLMAQVVIIKNNFKGGLKLCDVRIMVCNDGFYDNLCANECHCLEGKMCNKVSGQCPDKCASGWMGTNCQITCPDGKFGPSCLNSCHCSGDDICQRLNGSCAKGCDVNWVGPACQTAIPKLKSEPLLKESHMSDIIIKWPTWSSHLDDTIQLYYSVEYKQSSHQGNNSTHGDDAWLPGVTVDHHHHHHQGHGFTEAMIDKLQKNTFYEFRVTPILKILSTNEEIIGGRSPGSPPYRTKCNNPESPSILSLYSWEDSSSNTAAVTIEWTPLNKHQSNCDDIFYYEILYQKFATSEWKSEKSSHLVSTRNVSNLEFGTDYWFVVVAHNNQPLDSSSDRKFVTTIPGALSLKSYKHTRVDFGILLGLLACGLLTVLIIFVALIYRRQLKKYNSLPQNEHDSKLQASDMVISTTELNHINIHNPNLPNINNLLTNGNRDEQDNDILDPPFLHPRSFLLENGNRGGSKLKEIPTPSIPTDRGPIKVDELVEYVRLGKDNDCQLLRKEFKEIPDMNVEASSSSGNKTENRYKNRFINILPYDHSRVILDGIGSDYINANYIDGYKKPKAYIASQGCNKWTVEDMWRMVWQVDALRIVMVTNLIEKGRVKCEQYWSDVENEEKLYGDVIVTLRDVEMTTDYIIRTFELKQKDTEEVRNVKQFHYVAWPDHGVPDRVWPIISFRRKVRQYDGSHPGVVLVHCSAGVGRTGAYIALDYLLDQAASEDAIDVFEFTSCMRKDRVNMIQTLDQYIFVYDALLEALNIKNTIISSSDFPKKFNQLKTKLIKKNNDYDTTNINGDDDDDDADEDDDDADEDDDDDLIELQKEYNTLTRVSYKDTAEDYALGDNEENREKNRYPNILPADKHRPYLLTRVQGTNDYINAVYLDSYRKKNAYLITQMPMTHTVIDMWRLVYEVQCGTLIMLNSWDENDETYGQYWSEENEECECGPFMIEATSINRDNKHITVRELKLTFNGCDDDNDASIATTDNEDGDKTNQQRDNNNKNDDNNSTNNNNTNNNNTNNINNNNNNNNTNKHQQTVNHFQLNVLWPSYLNDGCDTNLKQNNNDANVNNNNNGDGGDNDVATMTTLKTALINLLEFVEKSQIKTGNNPIIIHCRDGVTHSGLYATISCVIERLKDEQEVDIFQSVRRMRDHRPTIIRNYEQYKFCYEMVLNYLSEFSIYSNFR